MGKQNLTWTLLVLSGFLASRESWAKEIQLAYSNEQNLETAGAPYAPTDVSKAREVEYTGSLSKTQRNDLLGQFKGLVHMGLRKVAYEKWQGRDMADCVKSANAGDHWTYRCQILTGEGTGDYYFYPNESRQVATLQELDIRVDSADEKILEDFRRPVQELFGKGSVVPKPWVHAQAKGLVRHWNTGEDVVELFMDHSVRPEGSVRFVWMRAPLVSGSQAFLTTSPSTADPQ